MDLRQSLEIQSKIGDTSLLHEMEAEDNLKQQIYLEFSNLLKTSSEIALSRPIDESATLPCNNHKNRYTDVLPTKETAIKLTPLGPGREDTTYINANLVLDEHQRQSYICCQAPLGSTMGDFWRMIWENGVCIIVMITKLREKDRAKADRYWPLGVGDTTFYNDGYSVKFVKESTRPESNLTIRTFHLRKEENQTNATSQSFSMSVSQSGSDEDPMIPGTTSGSSEDDCLISNEDHMSSDSREDSGEEGMNLDDEPELDKGVRKIIQLHCTEWPDFGVPTSTNSMYQLIQELDLRKGTERNKKSPICVHCSAGIGRTGTFVAIHISLENWLADEEVNIFNTVKNLRFQRQGMVQTKEQYFFIHSAVNDIIQTKAKSRARTPSKRVKRVTSSAVLARRKRSSKKGFRRNTTHLPATNASQNKIGSLNSSRGVPNSLTTSQGGSNPLAISQGGPRLSSSLGNPLAISQGVPNNSFSISQGQLSNSLGFSGPNPLTISQGGPFSSSLGNPSPLSSSMGVSQNPLAISQGVPNPLTTSQNPLATSTDGNPQIQPRKRVARPIKS